MRLSDYVKDSSDYIFGWLGYSDQNVHDRTCLLRDSDNKIELVIPFQGSCSEIESWFTNAAQNILLQTPHLPTQLWIKDVINRDTLCLIEPRVTYRSISTGTSQGYAILTPNFIVKGAAGIDYSKVNRVRSYIPELTTWTGLSSLQITYEPRPDGAGGVTSFSAGFESGQRKAIITAPNDMNLELISTDSSTTVHGLEPRVSVQGGVSFESSTAEQTALTEHINHHLDLTSLLSLITWRNVGFKSLSVLSDKDVMVTIDEKIIGPWFRQLISNIHETWKEPKKHRPFLIRYTDIGEVGLANWFRLKQAYPNPLNEITYVARMHDALTLQSQILIYGTAFEELGSAIAKQYSEDPHASIATLISLIIKDCELALFNDGKAIAEAISGTYNAIKHADFNRANLAREQALSTDNLFKVATASRALSLLWVGCKLGCGERFIEDLKQESAIAVPI